MSLVLRVGGPDGTLRSFRAQLKAVRSDLRAASLRLADFRRPLLLLHRRINQEVRRRFQEGFPNAPLKASTLRHRRFRQGYYIRPPKFRGKPGRWTGRMFQGLLGKPPFGATLIKRDRYLREYSASAAEVFGTESFLFGRGPAGWDRKGQKPRPAWPAGFRQRVARSIIREYVNKRVVSRLLGRAR